MSIGPEMCTPAQFELTFAFLLQSDFYEVPLETDKYYNRAKRDIVCCQSCFHKGKYHEEQAKLILFYKAVQFHTSLHERSQDQELYFVMMKTE